MSFNFFLDNPITKTQFPKFEARTLPETNAKQLFSLFELVPSNSVAGLPRTSLQNSPLELNPYIGGLRNCPSDGDTSFARSPCNATAKRAFFTASKSVARISTPPKLISILRLPRCSSCFLQPNRSDNFEKIQLREDSVEANFCSPVRLQSPIRHRHYYLGGSQMSPVRRPQDLIEGKINSGKDICQ